MTAEEDIANDMAVFLSGQSTGTTATLGRAILGKMVLGVIGTGTNYGEIDSEIFVNYKPPEPDNVVCVFGYAGSPPRRTHGNRGEGHPGVQIWVRNTSAATGRSLIESVFNELDGIVNTTLSGTFYQGIFANQHPEPMGKDENGRSEFACNFSVLYRR